MSYTLDRAMRTQFQDTVIHLAQQKKSRLMGAVMNKSIQDAKEAYFERLGPSDPVLKTSVNQASPSDDAEHDRRRLQMEDYHKGRHVDPTVKLRMIISPESEYVKEFSAGFGRKIDDVIIAAATANVTEVAADGSTSTVALAHTVDEDTGSANSDVNLAKILQARRILMQNEVDDDELYFAVDALSIEAMLGIDEIKNADYNAVKVLVNGEVSSFMGFKFIPTERLSNSSEGFKQCLAWAKSGLGLGVGKDYSLSVQPDVTKSMSNYIYGCMSLGAIRIEEEKVIVVEAYRA